MPACIHVQPPRGLIKGVVIDELPHERRARHHRRVIRIGPMRVGGRRVAANHGIEDQKACGPAARSSCASTISPGIPHLQQRRPHRVIRIGARWQVGEDPPDVHAALRRPPVAVREEPPGPTGRTAGSAVAEVAGPTELASSPAPTAPTPFKKPRREGRICASSIVIPMSSRPAQPVSGHRVRPG